MSLNNDPRYVSVVQQAEELVLRQRREEMDAQYRDEELKLRWKQGQRAKVKFLKDYEAVPMAVSAYNEWLASYVDNGGELAQYINGQFPTVRYFEDIPTTIIVDPENGQAMPLNGELIKHISLSSTVDETTGETQYAGPMVLDPVTGAPRGIPITSLDEEYYSEPIIWTIDKPVNLGDIPTLSGEQCITLHFTQNAVAEMTSEELAEWHADDASGENEIYVDGDWFEGTWHPGAYTIKATPYVWRENCRIMLGQDPEF